MLTTITTIKTCQGLPVGDFLSGFHEYFLENMYAMFSGQRERRDVTRCSDGSGSDQGSDQGLKMCCLKPELDPEIRLDYIIQSGF